MKNVGVQKLIQSNSGVVIQSTVNYDEKVIYAVRPLSLTPLERVPAGLTLNDDGILWLLKFEFANLAKRPNDSYMIREVLRLADNDDFEFGAIEDNDFLSDSTFARAQGMDRLSSWSNVPKLSPKIKVSTALLYLLPRAHNGEIFLAVGGESTGMAYRSASDLDSAPVQKRLPKA